MTDTAGNQQPVMGTEPVAGAAVQPSTTPAATAESWQEEKARMQKALQDANKEAESRRKKIEEYESKEKLAEEAKLSEMEKLQKQVAEANAAKDAAIKSANAKLIKAEILQKASKFIDADAAYALVDTSKITVKEDGSVDGVDAALAELEKAKPNLLKSANGRVLDATNPGGDATNETAQQRHNRIFGEKVDPFAESFAIKHGGGVVSGD